MKVKERTLAGDPLSFGWEIRYWHFTTHFLQDQLTKFSALKFHRLEDLWFQKRNHFWILKSSKEYIQNLKKQYDELLPQLNELEGVLLDEALQEYAALEVKAEFLNVKFFARADLSFIIFARIWQ